jgi:glyoxylase-like metal-dependent hydrolase (beta-lactamase superfamily II)
MQMKAAQLLTALALACVPAGALAQSRLQLKTFTASPEGFSVNSTLVYGDRDAVLIDAQFTQSDAQRVAKEIADSGRNLTTVYVTHDHPDHYFGADVIKRAFPKARIVALPAVIKAIRASAEPKVRQWKPMYGDNLTSSPVIPEPLEGTSLKLEGETLQIVGGLQGDDSLNSYVWIPSLKAAIVGDIAFYGIYAWTADTTPAERKRWIKTLEDLAARKPALVVAGHKRPELKDDPSSLHSTREYLAFFEQARAGSKSADELMKKVKAKYPDLGLEVILKIGSQAAFAAEKR